MSLNSSQINCPQCASTIPFDPYFLISGQKISCPNANCDTVIGIAENSLEVAKNALEKLEHVKKKEVNL